MEQTFLAIAKHVDNMGGDHECFLIPEGIRVVLTEDFFTDSEMVGITFSWVQLRGIPVLNLIAEIDALFVTLQTIIVENAKAHEEHSWVI